MFARVVILFLISKVAAQYNGEFWWLNEKLAKYNADVRPPAKFEDLSEFDTDESAKIIFRDNDLVFEDKRNEKGSSNKDFNKELKVDFQDKSQIVWPSHSKEKSTMSHPITNRTPQNKGNKNQVSDDIFEFKFPENDNDWKNLWNDYKAGKNTTQNTEENENNNGPNKEIIINYKISLKVQKGEVHESENICTFLKKTECNRKRGSVYINNGSSKKVLVNSQLICCILPISAEEASKIHFIEAPTKIHNRNKRSTIEDKISPALRQRNALLQRKYASQAHKATPTIASQTKITQKIITSDDDYIDPYWNIKNLKFKNPNSQNKPNQPSISKYEYGTDDYVEDYVVELPKPGLMGLYSDNNGRPPNWSFGNENTGSSYGGAPDEVVSDEEDSHPSFGYGATIDPRLEDRLSVLTKTPKLKRPAHLTTRTTSDEYMYNSESQTINYQSNPDFQVLQGYKLLNLMRNKSRIHKNEKKTTTTENDEDNDSKESVLIAGNFDENDNDYVFDTNQQVHRECGKVTTKQASDEDRKIGDAENGSHPWLTLVVLTRRWQTILCYATLVHVRAAVTAADCVHGRICPGEVTLIAGARDLNEESHEEWQKRMVSVHLHAKYKPGELAKNLAILHWKRPLRLNVNVQPACLTDPQVGDDCKFFGWGGYDQVIRPHSRWQRAIILTQRACGERLSSKRVALPSDAFCASVPSRATVTGLGGPLVCTVGGGRHAAAGVAVWRDGVLVLLPVHEWTVQILNQLQLQ